MILELWRHLLKRFFSRKPSSSSTGMAFLTQDMGHAQVWRGLTTIFANHGVTSGLETQLSLFLLCRKQDIFRAKGSAMTFLFGFCTLERQKGLITPLMGKNINFPVCFSLQDWQERERERWDSFLFCSYLQIGGRRGILTNVQCCRHSKFFVRRSTIFSGKNKQTKKIG